MKPLGFNGFHDTFPFYNYRSRSESSDGAYKVHPMGFDIAHGTKPSAQIAFRTSVPVRWLGKPVLMPQAVYEADIAQAEHGSGLGHRDSGTLRKGRCFNLARAVRPIPQMQDRRSAVFEVSRNDRETYPSVRVITAAPRPSGVKGNETNSGILHKSGPQDGHSRTFHAF